MCKVDIITENICLNVDFIIYHIYVHVDLTIDDTCVVVDLIIYHIYFVELIIDNVRVVE